MADTVTITVTEVAETVTINVSQYNVPTPVTENDFIVSNATPGWVRRTLAQVRTILGLGTAAYTAATDYVTHALATAANDFLVASGAGVFVKKTFTEVRGLLNPYYYQVGNSILETVIIPAGFMERTFANPLAIDLSLSRDFKCSSVTGSTTINLSEVNDGRAGMIVLIVDGTGGYTLTLGAAFTLALNSTALSGLANKKNVISYVCFGSDVIYTVNVI